MPEKIIRPAEMEILTGLSDRQLRNMEKAGRFPRRFQLSDGGKAVGWTESEYNAFVAARAATRDPKAA